MSNPRFRDDDYNWTYEGDVVSFCYGIPPIYVTGKVVNRNGTLYVLTPKHNPPECELRMLRRHVGAWYRKDDL